MNNEQWTKDNNEQNEQWIIKKGQQWKKWTKWTMNEQWKMNEQWMNNKWTMNNEQWKMKGGKPQEKYPQCLKKAPKIKYTDISLYY